MTVLLFSIFDEVFIPTPLLDPHLDSLVHFGAHESVGRWSQMHIVPEEIRISLDRVNGWEKTAGLVLTRKDTSPECHIA